MAEPKTKPTKASVEKHIAAIAKDEQRNDAHALVALMRRVTRQEPKMWGPRIVGFGSYHYKFASGHEGDSALAGFAVRKSEFAIYIVAGFDGQETLLAKLGKHRAAFAYVNAFTAHVNVGFFRGAEIADPEGLLEGSGKFMRHVKLRPDRAVNTSALTNLIKTAYSDMKVRCS